MKIGYIGLGKMGKNMVLRLLDQEIEVVAWNRSPVPLEEVVEAGAVGTKDLESLVLSLRGATTANDGVVIWLMLPAGDITDEYIDKLLPFLSTDDLLVDGGNSFYKDSIKRAEELSQKGIHFMDIGVSGGPAGARNGACLMIGGSKEDFKKVEPVCKAASAPNAYQYLGPVGAGHFAKMVHNAIEYGMMESIGEGLAVLKKAPFEYDFIKLLDLYNHGSVIESRLIGWALNAFNEDPNLSNISSVIGTGGTGKERVKSEGDWIIKLAKQLGVDTPAIESSMKVRSESVKIIEESSNGFRNKVISALRGQFGQHDVKKK